MSGSWEKSPIDILVATPISAAELIYYDWHENLLNNWLSLPAGLKVARQKFPEPCIEISRDKAVHMAIQAGARWLWFLDADILPPQNALVDLLNADKLIISGLYVRRHNPPFNEMLRFRTDGIPGLRPIQDGEYIPGEIISCDAVATGCLLINTEVFDRLKPRQITIDGQPARPSWFLWTEWRLPTGYSEDFSFTTWAKQNAIDIYCHTGIRCDHAGMVKFTPSGNNSISFKFPGTF